MEAILELMLEELKHLCSQWILLGYYLQVANVHTIAASHPGDDKRCLEEVLREWLKKGKDPSWKKLCSALEAGGLSAEAEHIREKYYVPGEHICNGVMHRIHENRTLLGERTFWKISRNGTNCNCHKYRCTK